LLSQCLAERYQYLDERYQCLAERYQSEAKTLRERLSMFYIIDCPGEYSISDFISTLSQRLAERPQSSKLLWSQSFHQVKLFSRLNLLTREPGEILIHFKQDHDGKYEDKTIELMPENGITVIDWEFCRLSRIQELKREKEKCFVLKIKNSTKLEMLENRNYLIGTGKEQVEVRVLTFRIIVSIFRMLRSTTQHFWIGSLWHLQLQERSPPNKYTKNPMLARNQT
jgi:hypothetical protein